MLLFEFEMDGDPQREIDTRSDKMPSTRKCQGLKIKPEQMEFSNCKTLNTAGYLRI